MAYVGLLWLSVVVAFFLISGGNAFCNCRDERGDFSALQCERYARNGCGDGCRPQEAKDEPTCISSCETGDNPFFCSGRNQFDQCGCFGKGNDADVVKRMRNWLDQNPLDMGAQMLAKQPEGVQRMPQPQPYQQEPPRPQRPRNYYPNMAAPKSPNTNNPSLSWLMIESSFVMSVVALVVSGVTLAAFVGYLCQSTSPTKGGAGYRAVDGITV
jgi:hypothetical protein